MTEKQIEHVVERLIEAIDKFSVALEKRSATPSELEALSKVALALAEIHKL